MPGGNYWKFLVLDLDQYKICSYSQSPLKKIDKKFGFTLYCPVTPYLQIPGYALVSKTPHFMYLLLTLVLPESLLVIRFIYWHTEYLPFTTKGLIWGVCVHVPKYEWETSSGLCWDDPELFFMEYFQNPELVIIYTL